MAFFFPLSSLWHLGEKTVEYNSSEGWRWRQLSVHQSGKENERKDRQTNKGTDEQTYTRTEGQNRTENELKSLYNLDQFQCFCLHLNGSIYSIGSENDKSLEI
jgi:hypothetical protein